MSKAEERSKKLIIPKQVGDIEELCRFYYIKGYHQAEKDLELTIEGIKKIHTFLYAIKHNKQGAFTLTRLSDEQYQEVLNRFNKQKGR